MTLQHLSLWSLETHMRSHLLFTNLNVSISRNAFERVRATRKRSPGPAAPVKRGKRMWSTSAAASSPGVDVLSSDPFVTFGNPERLPRVCSRFRQLGGGALRFPKDLSQRLWVHS